MPLHDEQLQWILDTTRDLNTQVMQLSQITAGHAMICKIFSGIILLVVGTLIPIAWEVFTK